MNVKVSVERVLVVDDDESIRQIVRLCLSDEGYDVFEAANGQAALKIVDEHPPSLILLDLRMPIMDGITAAEFIYYSTAGTPGGQVQNGGVTYVPMLVQ